MLVKPQFEAGRERLGTGGVVRDPQVHRDVLREVLESARTLGLIFPAPPSPPRATVPRHRCSRAGRARLRDCGLWDALTAVTRTSGWDGPVFYLCPNRRPI